MDFAGLKMTAIAERALMEDRESELFLEWALKGVFGDPLPSKEKLLEHQIVIEWQNTIDGVKESVRVDGEVVAARRQSYLDFAPTKVHTFAKV